MNRNAHPQSRPPVCPVRRAGVRALVRLGLTVLVLGFVGGAPVLWGASPSFSAAYLDELCLARQCYTNADYTRSLAHYQAATRAAPQSLEARLGSLLPLLALERFAEAESLANRVLAEYPANYYASLHLASALRGQEKFAAAEAVLNRAVALHPTDVPLLLELALVKLGRQENATARVILLDVLTLAPGNAVALQHLGSPELIGEPRDQPLPPGSADAFNPLGTPGKVRVETTAYYGYLQYHDTAAKDHIQAGGLYASLGWGGQHLVETEADYLNKFYRGYHSLCQWDNTLTYANFSVPHLKLRVGGQYITSDDPFTDQGWVAFGGAEYYVANRWGAGLDGYFTRYPNFQDQLAAAQLTPHLDTTLWSRERCRLDNDLRGYWIHLNHEFEGRQDLFSVEDRLSFNWRRWTFSAFGWAGEQIFAVRSDGFAVFNLGEKHDAGYGLELRYDFSRRFALTLRANREEFEDTAATPHASSDMYLALLSLQF